MEKPPLIPDATDRKILGLLQRDAAMPVAEIAERVGLSQSTCWRRIALLEEAGVVKRRVALLDAAKLGLEVVVFANVKLSTLG